MRRRVAMMLGSAAAVATPKWAAAQEGRRPRLAVVDSYEVVAQMTATGSNRMYGSFIRELRRLGRIEGTNLTIERWSANSESAQVATVARDVVASRPDAIFAGDVSSGRALRMWTSDIPIVMAGGSFHAWGIKSLSRPGGNVTGITIEQPFDILAKDIELLHESVPTASSAAFLGPIGWFQLANDPWKRRGLTFVGMDVDHLAKPVEYRNAFAEAATKGADLLVVAETRANYAQSALIVELAAQSRLLAIFPTRDPVEIGGLMSYGVDYAEWGRQSAGYVTRILRGEKPAELPVQVLDKFELVINLKTAKALGLTIPPAILARADEVIE